MVVIKDYEDGTVVRIAEPEDKNAVGDIVGHGSVDIIKRMYDHYMEHPNFLCFLAEFEGRVVAFCFMYLVDDGEVVIWGGKRVHEDFRGQGFLPKLTVPVEEYVSLLYPQITTWRYSAVWNDFQKRHIPELQEEGALQKVIFRMMLGMKTDLSYLQSLESQEKFHQLCDDYDIASVTSPQEPDEIPTELLDPANQSELFPQDLFFVLWQPYRPLHSNFEYIMQTCQCNITYSGSKIVAVSFLSALLLTNSTLRFDVEIYVSKALPDNQQQRYLKQHIVAAMASEWPRCHSHMDIPITFYFDTDYDTDATKAWIFNNFPGVNENSRSAHQQSLYMACDYDRSIASH